MILSVLEKDQLAIEFFKTMTLFKEVELMYKEINNVMNEINTNIILLIENTNKILYYGK